jgi:hypothetical protein
MVVPVGQALGRPLACGGLSGRLILVGAIRRAGSPPQAGGLPHCVFEGACATLRYLPLEMGQFTSGRLSQTRLVAARGFGQLVAWTSRLPTSGDFQDKMIAAV